MKGHQELCKALGVMETAALEGHSGTNVTNPLRPLPRWGWQSWPYKEGLNPNPCALWGCWRWGFHGEAPLQVKLLCKPSWGSLAGKAGSSSGQGDAVLGLCKEKGPVSLSALFPQGSQLLLPPVPIASPSWASLSGAGAAPRCWARR